MHARTRHHPRPLAHVNAQPEPLPLSPGPNAQSPTYESQAQPQQEMSASPRHSTSASEAADAPTTGASYRLELRDEIAPEFRPSTSRWSHSRCVAAQKSFPGRALCCPGCGAGAAACANRSTGRAAGRSARARPRRVHTRGNCSRSAARHPAAATDWARPHERRAARRPRVRACGWAGVACGHGGAHACLSVQARCTSRGAAAP